MDIALTPPALKRDRFSRVEAVGDAGDCLRVKFRGIDSLEDSEKIVGCYLLARENDLDLGAFDVAYNDLIGRTVEDARYGELGNIAEVIETPANDVWSIEGPYGEVLVPVIDQVVSEIPDEGPIRIAVMDGIIDAPAPEEDAC